MCIAWRLCQMIVRIHDAEIMKKYLFSKKQRTVAEINWRQERHDERWEIRVDYLMEVFSGVSVMLPRQIAHQNAENEKSQL